MPSVPSLVVNPAVGAGVVRVSWAPVLNGQSVTRVSAWHQGVNVFNTSATPANPKPIPAPHPMLEALALQGRTGTELVAEVWVEYGTSGWTTSQVAATPSDPVPPQMTVTEHISAALGEPFEEGETVKFKIVNGDAVPA